MIPELREVYLDTFCIFIKNRYGTVEREPSKEILDTLFDYGEERKTDIFSFQEEDVDQFMNWLTEKREDRDLSCHRMVLVDFYEFLQLLDYVPSNPFREWRDRELEKLSEKIDERYSRLLRSIKDQKEGGPK
jgi:site-specific recombinase XerD